VCAKDKSRKIVAGCQNVMMITIEASKTSILKDGALLSECDPLPWKKHMIVNPYLIASSLSLERLEGDDLQTQRNGL
jgi:hypothetical protein